MPWCTGVRRARVPWARPWVCAHECPAECTGKCPACRLVCLTPIAIAGARVSIAIARLGCPHVPTPDQSPRARWVFAALAWGSFPWGLETARQRRCVKALAEQLVQAGQSEPSGGYDPPAISSPLGHGSRGLVSVRTPLVCAWHRAEDFRAQMSAPPRAPPARLHKRCRVFKRVTGAVRS